MSSVILDPVAPIDVAVLMTGIGRLTGGGGAERYFADVVSQHRRLGKSRLRMWLVTDPQSLAALGDSGRTLPRERILVVEEPGPLGRRLFPRLRFARSLLEFQRRVSFDIVYLPLPSPRYLPALWGVACLPHGFRPRIVLGVVDCGLAHSYRNGRWRIGTEQWKVNCVYRLFFRGLPIDGVLTWYQSVEEAFRQGGISSRPTIHASPYCFVDSERFHPEAVKERRVIFAARLSHQKRPLMFLEAVERLVESHPRLVEGWTFEMYGSGPLEGELQRSCDRLRLGDRVSLRGVADLAPILAGSRIFVSTQAHENFSSLAMLEAMAAGNALVAFNVGETWRFVREGENGVLAREENAEGLAKALALVLERDTRQLDALGRRSRAIAIEDFAPERFLADLEAFCQRVLAMPHRTWWGMIAGRPRETA